MNSMLEITPENLGIGKGLLNFLVKNLEDLADDTQYYPVMFRCGDYRTVFICKKDIEALIDFLRDRVDSVDK